MFEGCHVALVTPFRDGRIDAPAFDELLDHVLAGGVAGVVVCGTTGESPCLSADEQTELVRAAARRVKGRAMLVAGTGTNCTEETLALSQAAARAGADAVMLVSPYYNRPSQRGLFEHFAYVASAVHVPVVLYNIPGRTAVELAPDTIAKLRIDCPNIVALKHATGSVEAACEVMELCDIEVLSGDDTLTLPLMSVGAVGVVSVAANLLPAEMAAMVRVAREGRLAEARRLNRELMPLMRGLMRLDTNPVPIKTALAMRGMMTDEFRLPLCRMEPAQRERLASILAHYPSPRARQPA